MDHLLNIYRRSDTITYDSKVHNYTKKKYWDRYLVGKAARLVTGGIPIAAIIHGQTIKLVPESITNRSVIGVMMQPCLAIINRSRQGNE
ncbi:MAG: hypothetical protein ACXWC7_12960 [Chitinophagaceae bacterium]